LIFLLSALFCTFPPGASDLLPPLLTTCHGCTRTRGPHAYRGLLSRNNRRSSRAYPPPPFVEIASCGLRTRGIGFNLVFFFFKPGLSYPSSVAFVCDLFFFVAYERPDEYTVRANRSRAYFPTLGRLSSQMVEAWFELKACAALFGFLCLSASYGLFVRVVPTLSPGTVAAPPLCDR